MGRMNPASRRLRLNNKWKNNTTRQVVSAASLFRLDLPWVRGTRTKTAQRVVDTESLSEDRWAALCILVALSGAGFTCLAPWPFGVFAQQHSHLRAGTKLHSCLFVYTINTCFSRKAIFKNYRYHNGSLSTSRGDSVAVSVTVHFFQLASPPTFHL